MFGWNWVDRSIFAALSEIKREPHLPWIRSALSYRRDLDLECVKLIDRYHPTPDIEYQQRGDENDEEKIYEEDIRGPERYAWSFNALGERGIDDTVDHWKIYDYLGISFPKPEDYWTLDDVRAMKPPPAEVSRYLLMEVYQSVDEALAFEHDGEAARLGITLVDEWDWSYGNEQEFLRTEELNRTWVVTNGQNTPRDPERRYDLYHKEYRPMNEILAHPTIDWGPWGLSAHPDLTIKAIDVLSISGTGGWDWLRISKFISIEEVNRYPNRPWKRAGLSRNPGISILTMALVNAQYQEEVDDTGWDWSHLSENLGIWEILEHPDCPWDKERIRKNQTITPIWVTLVEATFGIVCDRSLIAETCHPLDLYRGPDLGYDPKDLTRNPYLNAEDLYRLRDRRKDPLLKIERRCWLDLDIATIG